MREHVVDVSHAQPPDRDRTDGAPTHERARPARRALDGEWRDDEELAAAIVAWVALRDGED